MGRTLGNESFRDGRSFEAFDKGIRHFCGHTLSLYFKVGPVLVQSRAWSRERLTFFVYQLLFEGFPLLPPDAS